MGTEGLLSSMFHRRLLLLMVLLVFPIGLVSAQLVRLTVVEGARYRAEAESKLVVRRWEPTTRGRILDRKGRILAQDRPSFDVAIDYAVMSGEWATSMGAKAARLADPDRWTELGPGQRDDLIEKYVPFFESRVEQAWARLVDETGVPRDDLEKEKRFALERVDTMVSYIRDKRFDKELERLHERGREITTEVEQEITESLRKQRILEQEIAHPLLFAVEDELAFRLMRLADLTETIHVRAIDGAPPLNVEDVPLMPGLVITDSSTREYPFMRAVVDVDTDTLPPPLATEGHVSLDVDGVGTHLLGWMGPRPLDGDIDRRQERIETDPDFAERVVTEDGTDRGRYQPGDAGPRAGVEWSMEHVLRGLRGLTVLNLETGVERTLDPVDGRDVRLTIDAMLQARVQAVMDPELGLARVQPWHNNQSDIMQLGTPLYGAAVVIEIETGDVLAMVSTPSFTREELNEDPDSIFKDRIRAPWVNKAIQKPYPPGSIAKAIVLSEAVTRGKLGLHERIACTGHLYPNDPEAFRCWIYRDRYYMQTHSGVLGRDPDITDALMVSCNIFSYTVGRRLGPDGITEVYEDFGVGQPLDLGVGEQFNGHIGLFGKNPPPLNSADATFMGMGQGPVTWTPLHAANAFATLARGGYWIEPRVIDNGRPPVGRDLDLDANAVGAAMQGLYNVVNDADNGTAHHITYDGEYGKVEIFNAPGVDVWGKTGTAQAPLLRDVDPDGPEGPELGAILRDNDHSWFTALVAPEGQHARYAICVIMERAGSGGRVSGPICNQIIHALVTEGYLEP